jgi:hypothetical protein
LSGTCRKLSLQGKDELEIFPEMKLLLNVKITKSIEMEIAHQISSPGFTVPYKSASGKMPSAVLKPICDLEAR